MFALGLTPRAGPRAPRSGRDADARTAAELGLGRRRADDDEVDPAPVLAQAVAQLDVPAIAGLVVAVEPVDGPGRVRAVELRAVPAIGAQTLGDGLARPARAVDHALGGVHGLRDLPPHLGVGRAAAGAQRRVPGQHLGVAGDHGDELARDGLRLPLVLLDLAVFGHGAPSQGDQRGEEQGGEPPSDVPIAGHLTSTMIG